MIHVQILFSKLLQGIEYSFLCYIIGPCSLPILHTVACIFQFQAPNLPLSPLVTINLLSL